VLKFGLNPVLLRPILGAAVSIIGGVKYLSLHDETLNPVNFKNFSMAGQLKEVRNRIKSVQSTQQITKAMKMVSAAKLRRAQDAITQMRPYAKKLQEMLSNIVSNSDGEVGMALAAERTVEKVLLIVITSDRGLAGAFNTNVIKLSKSTIAERYSEQYKKGNVTIWNIGKKGYEHFFKNGYKATDTYKDIFLNLTFENVQKASQAAMKAFEEKQFDVVEIIYSQFKNAATQKFEAERFLPIPKVEKKEGSNIKADFIYDPSKEELVAELMPKILNTQLYKAVLDSNASEHGARMTAMDKASENANELLRNLKISYNRARQAAITTELTEIVSGAAALQG
jgi:F-type H+-transporting ATPase subunit gamma